MEEVLENEASSSLPLTGLQAAVISQVAPRAFAAARVLFRRHPVIFVSSLVLGAIALRRYQKARQRSRASFQAQTDPADLIH